MKTLQIKYFVDRNILKEIVDVRSMMYENIVENSLPMKNIVHKNVVNAIIAGQSTLEKELQIKYVG